MSILNDFVERKEKLFFYSPYNFIRKITAEKIFSHLENSIISKFGKSEKNRIIEINIDGHQHLFLVSFLDWDTNYFKINTYKLFTVLYHHNQVDILIKAVKKFLTTFFIEEKYCFIELPSEDILLLQALSVNGFRLIETRLTYFNDDLSNFNHQRFLVRKANENDIETLKKVAIEMRNNYDRFHADKIFSEKNADEFLSTYIENSIKGFADIVLVPNEKNIPSESFLTANYLKDDWNMLNTKVSKMVLSAVSSANNKGWYSKLISEMTYFLRDEIGNECIFMNTQSTNRAVFKTWEKLGYRLGATHHIFSYTNYLNK